MKTITLGSREIYECKFDWPGDCFVQGGEDGMVVKSIDNVFSSSNPIIAIAKELSYITAFFEAFPRQPDTFIRGEGSTIDEAEVKCWEKFQRYLSCAGHEFERRGYRNGCGVCAKCGMFGSKAFEPLEKCEICGCPTYHSVGSGEGECKWYCEAHEHMMPAIYRSWAYHLLERIKKDQKHEA